jgi:hypothetical protein
LTHCEKTRRKTIEDLSLSARSEPIRAQGGKGRGKREPIEEASRQGMVKEGARRGRKEGAKKSRHYTEAP